MDTDKTEQVTTLLVAANLVELGTNILENLAGTGLNGNVMQDNADIMSKELNRIVMEKAHA